MVWLHVMDNEIIYLPVANYFSNVLYELHEEVHFYCVYQYDFLIVDEIRIVTNSMGQRPQTFEKLLIAVVYAYIVELICYFYHIVSFICWFAKVVLIRQISKRK